jgi:hypothetical protein
MLNPLPISTLPDWEKMWLLATAIYLGCKVVSWSARSVSSPAWKQLAYVFAWPGMDCDTFLKNPGVNFCRPRLSEWFFAIVKLGIGLGLLWVIVPKMNSYGRLIQGWAGMIGIVFTMHFGLFHVISCFWRSCGIVAIPIMNWPIYSESLAEFWGRRWNLAFRDLTHRFLFSPLRRPFGPVGALLAGFVASGLVHDLVISCPAEGGYGLPTLYFSLQGLALLVERSRFGRSCGLGRGFPGWLFCLAIIALPSPLLFHAAFVEKVIYPFLLKIGSAS